MKKIILVFVVFIAFNNSANAQNKRPNIIYILADDLGYGSLGCYGNKNIHTPNIGWMAATGMCFTDYNSNGPVYSPTRVALLFSIEYPKYDCAK